MAHPAFVLRELQDAEVEILYDMTVKENWCLDLCDLTAVFHYNTKFWLAAVDDKGKIIGHCGSVSPDGRTVNIILFIVREELRGQGIGSALIRAVLDQHKGKPKYLNAVDPKVYEKYGFKDYYTVIMYSGTFHMTRPPTPVDLDPSIAIIDIDKVSVEKVMDFDAKVRGIPRSAAYFQDVICCSPEVHVTVANKAPDGVVVGYGVLRRRTDGKYEIAPLYADDDQVGEAVLRHLIQKLKDGDELRMKIVSTNESAKKWATGIGLSASRTTYTMSTEARQTSSLDAVYSLSSECCFDFI